MQRLFHRQFSNSIPRAELWLGTELLEKGGLEDSLEGHLALRTNLGMDLLFLPLSEVASFNASLGYRYFGPDDVAEATKISDLPVGVIIDGPFEKLVSNEGLIPVLKDWLKNPRITREKYAKEAAQVDMQIDRSLDTNVGVIVIADDVAGEKATYLNPEHSKTLFSPFYSQAVARIREKGVCALYHSCGNITAILPQLIKWGFDGLAACQGRSMDLPSLKKEYGSKLAFLAGIDAELLQETDLTPNKERSFINYVEELAEGGGFILCSSCGLYSSHYLERVIKLYEILDASIHRNNTSAQ
ncbi:uroporphyrinogen decarboxylase family protein [Thermodesulfobacteriota bacterium]